MKLKGEELKKRRIILEQRRNHLKEVKNKTRLEPVISEQVGPKFDKLSKASQEIRMMQFIPVDQSKCEVVIPPVTVKKKTTLVVTLKNKNSNLMTDSNEGVNIFIKSIRDKKAIQVEPIREVGGGKYEASFTASGIGHYMISIIIYGHHIQGSPYK